MNIIKRKVDISENVMRIFVLADLHIGDGLMDKDRLEQFIDDVMADDSNYIIINGDLINNETRQSVSDIFGAVMTPDEQIDYLVELLEPMRDKILVMIEGNHELRSYKSDGILVIKRVARELGIENCYSNGAYLLFIDIDGVTYSIYGKHGTGGGKTVGVKANRLIDMLDNVNADIFIHSHTHTLLVCRALGNYIHPATNEQNEVDHLYLNSSAFLKFGGYGEEQGFRPASTLYPHIILNTKVKLARAVI